jgi:hypothetical protein
MNNQEMKNLDQLENSEVMLKRKADTGSFVQNFTLKSLKSFKEKMVKGDSKRDSTTI